MLVEQVQHLRSRLGDGCPWILLAHSQHDAPTMLQVADLGGAAAVSFVVVLVAAALAIVVVEAVDRRAGWGRRLRGPVLLAVAAVQVTLVYTAELSPWKGGGFGMFSTTDDSGRRHVRIFVSAKDRSEEIAIAPSLEDVADRAAVLPTDYQLTRLAQRVVAREARYQRPVDVVRIDTWRIVYAPLTLTATSQLLRSFEYRVDPTVASR
jgi:hypothetical protein